MGSASRAALEFLTVIFTERVETLKCCVTSEKTDFKVSRTMFSFNNTGTGDVLYRNQTSSVLTV